MKQFFSYYNKIQFIIGEDSAKKFYKLLLLLVLFAFIEMIGIGIVIPIISLVGDSSLIETNKFLAFFYNQFEFNSYQNFIVAFGSFLIILYLIKIKFSIFTSAKNLEFSYRVLDDVTIKLVQNYINKDYEYFLKNDVSRLVKNCTLEVGNFATGVVVYSLNIITDLIVLIFISLFLFYINPTIFIVAFILIGTVLFIIYLLTFRKLKSLGQIREIAQSNVYKINSDIFNSVKDVKINEKEMDFLNYLRGNIQDYKSSAVSYEVLRVYPKYIIDGVIFITIVSLLIFAVIVETDTTKLVGIISVYALGLFKILPSINRITATLMAIKFYTPTVDIIYNELLENNFQKLAPNTDNEEISFRKVIKVNNISFSYDSSQSKAIDNLSLLIKKNTNIAFVGHSGSGKSTLVNILLGLLNNYDGVASIDGMDIRKNLKDYQRLIGYVPQHIFLFNDTLAFNIALETDKNRIDYKKIYEVLDRVKLTDVVNNLDEGIETFVGERGMKFSGGQIQRIGIARALYKNPSILIFDESTSALDNKTEKEIIKEINMMKGNITIIMIAHRLSTVEECDEIFVMDNGKIIEKGNFKELIQMEGYFYHEIYKHGQQL